MISLWTPTQGFLEPLDRFDASETGGTNSSAPTRSHRPHPHRGPSQESRLWAAASGLEARWRALLADGARDCGSAADAESAAAAAASAGGRQRDADQATQEAAAGRVETVAEYQELLARLRRLEEARDPQASPVPGQELLARLRCLEEAARRPDEALLLARFSELADRIEEVRTQLRTALLIDTVPRPARRPPPLAKAEPEAEQPGPARPPTGCRRGRTIRLELYDAREMRRGWGGEFTDRTGLCLHASMFACLLACMHACLPACMYTYLPTCMSTYINA